MRSSDTPTQRVTRRHPLSIVVSTHSSRFDAMSYAGEAVATIGRVAGMGFDGVELAIRDPRLVDGDQLLEVVRSLGLVVSAIGTGQAYVEEGLLLTSAAEDVRRAALQRLREHLPFAAEAGAVLIVGLIGTSSLDGQSVERAREHLVCGLRAIAAEAGAMGVRVALEPVNRYESPLLNTAEDGLRVLDAVGAGNVGLLMDTFHMNVEEASMPESIRRCGSQLFHLHAADSNRRHPGAGHIDFPAIVRALDDIDYRGFVSGEFLPYPSPDESANEYVTTFYSLDTRDPAASDWRPTPPAAE